MTVKAPGGMWLNKQAEAVNWFMHRFGAVNGYRFGRGGGWTGSKESADRSRRQYVNDMRWVKAVGAAQGKESRDGN
jgi:hypothetical protein